MLSLGRAGGGNLGFALDFRLSVSVSKAQKSRYEVLHSTGRNETEGLLEYIDWVWASKMTSSYRHHIVVSNLPPPHSGFGSSASLQIAVLAGLNWLYGLPLSKAQLRQLALDHYREGSDGKIIPAFTTGLASLLSLQGGFGLISPSGLNFFRFSSAPFNFLAAMPTHPRIRGLPAEIEQNLTFGEGRARELRDLRLKTNILLSRIIPAVRAGDLDRIGSAVRLLQSLGSKRAEIELCGGKAIYHAIDTIRSCGIQCVFMSAGGPSLVMISNLSAQEIQEASRSAGCEPMFSGVIDNTGIVINGACWVEQACGELA
ncbi:MAG: hypothetical protein ACJ76Y_32335 [Thermoanaerobaculia bacterium]